MSSQHTLLTCVCACVFVFEKKDEREKEYVWMFFMSVYERLMIYTSAVNV